MLRTPMARPPRRPYRIPDPELDQLAEQLVLRARALHGGPEETEPLRQILVTAMRLVSDGAAHADVRMLNSALKELRHAFRVFAPYENVRKVALFGSARTPPDTPDWQCAREFAERIVAEGWMVITGGGAGIMGAAQQGAGPAASFGLNIELPFEQAANPVIAGDPKLVTFRYFFTRKVMFVKEAHAFVLFPGGVGTHDEGFETLTLIQTGKSEILPVVFLDPPGGSYWRDWEGWVRKHLLGRGFIDEEDLALFKVTDDVGEAAAELLDFYRNYHSSRHVRDRLVLRMRRAPDAAALAALNRDFADLVTGGRIEASGALPEEAGEAAHLPRVVLRLDRRKVGRLRRLIDRLNDLVPDRASPREASPHEIVPGALPPEADWGEQD
jgi:uncharacterized protein (TIGR00730 family)